MSSVQPATGDARAELLALEDRRQRALVAVDIAALDSMFDESLVHIHAPGLIHNKAQILEHTATRRAYLEVTRGDLDIRLIGDDAAVITGPITNRLRTKEGGERTLAGVATQVLHRAPHGDWQFVSFQMTPYGEQEWPSLPSETAHTEQETS